jgi:hypothetical protein
MFPASTSDRLSLGCEQNPIGERVMTAYVDTAVLKERLSQWLETASAAGSRELGAVPTGWAEIDETLAMHAGGEARRGLRTGVVHEWFDTRDTPAAPPGPSSPRSSKPVRAPRRAWFPPLTLLVHLVWQAISPDPAELRDDGRRVLWIGRVCWPYARMLVRDGGDDARLLARSIFVDPPESADAAARLWAIDLALRSRAAAAVIADGSRLDLAATRRLQLAARAGGGLALIARPAWELSELSAAATRWVVRTEPTSGDRPRWSVELLRCKGVQPWEAHAEPSRASSHTPAAEDPRKQNFRGRGAWVLEWDRAQGAVVVPADVVGGSGEAASGESGREQAGRGASPNTNQRGVA